MTAGLALLLFALAPHGGNPTTVSALSWVIGLAVSFVAVVALTVFGRRHPGATGAAALGVATGVGFGLTAVLVKAMTAAYTHGIGAVFTSWQTYLVIIIGPASFFLLQNALQAGSLVASQPGLTLSNPALANLGPPPPESTPQAVAAAASIRTLCCRSPLWELCVSTTPPGAPTSGQQWAPARISDCADHAGAVL
jgi:hypothetical protein